MADESAVHRSLCSASSMAMVASAVLLAWLGCPRRMLKTKRRYESCWLMRTVDCRFCLSSWLLQPWLRCGVWRAQVTSLRHWPSTHRDRPVPKESTRRRCCLRPLCPSAPCWP